MSFLVHFGFPAFFKHLTEGSIVYCAAYALKDQPDGVVLLTSDRNVPGGTIHSVQMSITGDNPDALVLATSASEKIEEFLKVKGITMRAGVLLTTGLQDALRYWGRPSEGYSLTELQDLLEQGKEVSVNE